MTQSAQVRRYKGIAQYSQWQYDLQIQKLDSASGRTCLPRKHTWMLTRILQPMKSAEQWWNHCRKLFPFLLLWTSLFPGHSIQPKMRFRQHDCQHSQALCSNSSYTKLRRGFLNTCGTRERTARGHLSLSNTTLVFFALLVSTYSSVELESVFPVNMHTRFKANNPKFQKHYYISQGLIFFAGDIYT